MKSYHYITLVAMVFVAGVSGANAADVAVNGSFEVPDVTANTIDSPAVPGWTNVAFVMDSNGGWPGIFPDAGSTGPQYADFANTRSRIASTNFTIGQGLVIASITWDATSGGGSEQIPFVARIKNAGGTIVASGNFLAFGLTEYNTWDAYTLPITAQAHGPGNYVLEFFADQDTGSDLLADNIVIDTGLLIPEPASLMLFLGGSLLAIRRKRA